MSVGVGPSRRTMYCRASIEISAPWRFSRIKTSGFPPPIRVSERARSSKIWIRSSALRSSAAAASLEPPLAADEGGGRRPLDHAAGGQDHGAGELVAVEARPVAFERLGDLPRPLGAPGRVLLQALEHDPLELLADLGPQRAGRLGDLVDDAVEDRLDFSGKRRLAGQTLVQD